MSSDLAIRPATVEDTPALQEIRRAAFAPVFASFRSILGDELYELTNARADEEQAELLASLLAPGSGWDVYVAERTGTIVGFVSVQLDPKKLVGGVGTEMYRFALARMKDAGMKAATVGTGGDPSHAPARRAYEKVGFAVGIPSVWLCRAL